MCKICVHSCLLNRHHVPLQQLSVAAWTHPTDSSLHCLHRQHFLAYAALAQARPDRVELLNGIVNQYEGMLSSVAAHLPDTDFVINGLDEPRVLPGDGSIDERWANTHSSPLTHAQVHMHIGPPEVNAGHPQQHL